MTDFDKIYSMYFKDVYLYLRRLSGDEHLAEEITAQTFYKALKSLDKFRGDCDIRVWLCQIAKNSYYTHIEKNKRVESLDAKNAEAADGKSFTDIIEDKEAAKLIQSVLHSIEDPYKEVFMWRVYADMSFKEIGRIFSKSENWACVTYHRAKKMIKERLEEYGYEN
ncbi:MAG: sigma-70 family RNA polymerase sigma factor [Ruminococcaceae bacterium]|nr:sigma-70 family RNA polymerase sigma factor [Oscillospiraceae bacterium]